MKGLVVYFSHTGENMVNGEKEIIRKGFTEIVAEKISKYTGSELYKLVPVTDYPFGYKDCVNRARLEYENNSNVEFKNPKDNLDNYDTIYLGFPIWWRGYPRIIATFIRKYNNLKGKVVIPFCTNEEGAFGISELELRNALKEADIRGGFVTTGHNADKCDESLKAFLNK